MADLNVTLTIPDAWVNRVLNALCARGGYIDEATNGPKPAFAKAQLIKDLKKVVRVYEANSASKTAYVAKETEVDSGLNIT